MSFDRLTDRAREVFDLAQEEARMLQRGSIGTDHILLGLMSEGQGVAARAMERLGITLAVMRRQAKKNATRGTWTLPPGFRSAPQRKTSLESRRLALSGQANHVMPLSLSQALKLGHNYIGTEHILLGLMSQGGDSYAVRILAQLDIDLDRLRQQIMVLLAEEGRYLHTSRDMTTSSEATPGSPDGTVSQEPPPVGGAAEFERFNEPAQRVVLLAQEEARALKHNYVGTEHILLRMIHEDQGVAAQAMQVVGVSLEAVRQQVEEITERGQQPPSGHIPFTPQAKRVLELASRESVRLRHDYIGTEHILLGLIREGEGVAAQVLVAHGADLPTSRNLVLQVLAGSGQEADPPDDSTESGPRPESTAPAEDQPSALDKFTSRLRRVISLAREEARALNHMCVGTEHILLGLVREGEGVAANALHILGVSLDEVHRQVERTGARGEQPSEGGLRFSERAKRVLELALYTSLHHGHDYIGTEHLLLGIIHDATNGDDGPGTAADILMRLGVDLERLRQQVVRALPAEGHVGGSASLPAAPISTEAEPAEPASPAAPSADGGQPQRAGFSRDLTAAVRAGELATVVGRRQEIDRVLQVLSRRQRNTPLLIGERGVGRRSVVAGLAERIARDAVPEHFRGYTVRGLNLRGLLHRQDGRSRFAEVVDGVHAELRAGRAILLLEDALVPLPTPLGETTALGVFRSVVGVPGVHVVGTCTPEQFQQRDAADLDQVTQAVAVGPPSEAEALEILRGVRDRLTSHHGVRFADDALHAAVSLARTAVPDRPLPGAALDLLDETGAQIRVRLHDEVPEEGAAGEGGRHVTEDDVAAAAQDMAGAAGTPAFPARSLRTASPGRRTGPPDARDPFIWAMS